MNLFYFGTSQRRLLGVHEPPVSGGRGGVAVLCYPWGQEYVGAHQSMRLLSRLISQAGMHAFRFDWYGTGDSWGEPFESAPLDSWHEDLGLAIEEACDMTQQSTVSLVGLRLGGSVAAMAASVRHDVDRLVLWDPVSDGAAYAQELTATAVASPAYRDVGSSGAVLEVLGFPLTQETIAGLERVTTNTFSGELPPTLLLSTVDDPDRYEPLRTSLREGASELTDEVMAGPLAWVVEGDLGAAGMPVPALKRIAQWLA